MLRLLQHPGPQKCWIAPSSCQFRLTKVKMIVRRKRSFFERGLKNMSAMRALCASQCADDDPTVMRSKSSSTSSRKIRLNFVIDARPCKTRFTWSTMEVSEAKGRMHYVYTFGKRRAQHLQYKKSKTRYASTNSRACSTLAIELAPSVVQTRC